MTTIEFLLASQNIPFAVALGLMVVMAALEGAGTLLGAGLSDVLDSLIPDMDADIDVDVDAGDMGSAGALSGVLGWLHVGKVPVLMLLVVFLAGFGLIGYAIQYVVWSMTTLLLPAALVSLPALALSLPAVRISGGILKKIMPNDETSAVSVDTLVGRVATITLGTATRERAAEARVDDEHGTTHYVQVIPEAGHSGLAQQTQVLLVRREGNRFIAIESTGNTLRD